MTQLGKQPPRFSFFLNPYPDLRFTVCPRCGTKTRLRKFPLVVHVDPNHLLALNKTCRYCDVCDLLIVHQDELEEQLVYLFSTQAPQLIGNDYLVLGTLDRADWQKGRKGTLAMAEMLDDLHDFKEALRFEPDQRWVLDS